MSKIRNDVSSQLFWGNLALSIPYIQNDREKVLFYRICVSCHDKRCCILAPLDVVSLTYGRPTEHELFELLIFIHCLYVNIRFSPSPSHMRALILCSAHSVWWFCWRLISKKHFLIFETKYAMYCTHRHIIYIGPMDKTKHVSWI